MFGFATTYDLEDLEVQSDHVVDNFKALWEITNLHDHKIHYSIDLLHSVINESLPALVTLISDQNHQYQILVHSLTTLALTQKFDSALSLARSGFPRSKHNSTFRYPTDLCFHLLIRNRRVLPSTRRPV